MRRQTAVVVLVVIGAALIGVVGNASRAATAEAAADGPDWLPLKGTFKNAIGCTWNNGCQTPTPGYHGYPAVDFTVPEGTPVFAAGPGVIMVAYRGCPAFKKCGPNGSDLGNSIAIRHDNGMYSWYGHLSEVNVEEGWAVKTGEEIGKAGTSGSALGPALHYEERTALWIGPVSPGQMFAYQSSRKVSYPGALKFNAWDTVPCGRQGSQPNCGASHLLRNDGYTPQEAATPKPTPGVCYPQRMGVVFVIDDSGSNSRTDPRLLRADAARVALTYLPPGTLVSAVNFSNSAYTVLDTTRLTKGNSESIAQLIRSSLRTNGGTNYEAGFRQALTQLAAMRGVQRIVIFLSDGQPTSSYYSDRTIAAQAIPIHTVGYGPVRNLPVLIDISTRSKASYQPIDNVAEASNAFATIINPYQCSKAIGGSNLTLKPNKEYRRSFVVPRNTVGISALATWTHHAAPAVWLQRPDGSVLKPGAGAHAGERVTKPGLQVIKFDVSRPASGKWTLVARSKNWVSLAFDVWKTQKPPVAGGGGGSTTENFKYVALGDSYSAGEGIDPYFRDGADVDPKTKKGTEDNRCHRSSRAYAERVQPPGFTQPLYHFASGSGKGGSFRGENKYASDENVRSDNNVNWVFWACSGAVVKNIIPFADGGRSQTDITQGFRDVLPQLENKEIAGADLVTLTVGGNDVGFVDLLTLCAVRSDCTSFEKQTEGTIDATSIQLKRLYRAVRTKTRAGRILVLGYPQVFPERLLRQACPKLAALWSPKEQTMLRALGERLNRTIEEATRAVTSESPNKTPIEFVDVVDVFRGHEVCGADGEWINGLSATAKKSKGGVDDESFHPTETGQRLGYARAINTALRKAKP